MYDDDSIDLWVIFDKSYGSFHTSAFFKSFFFFFFFFFFFRTDKASILVLKFHIYSYCFRRTCNCGDIHLFQTFIHKLVSKLSQNKVFMLRF